MNYTLLGSAIRIKCCYLANIHHEDQGRSIDQHLIRFVGVGNCFRILILLVNWHRSPVVHLGFPQSSTYKESRSQSFFATLLNPLTCQSLSICLLPRIDSSKKGSEFSLISCFWAFAILQDYITTGHLPNLVPC